MFRLLHSALNRKALPISESDIRRQPHGLRARILASSAALLVSQGVTAAIYLISVPLFLHFWDAARYGKWVILTAVPTYFAMSDGGIVPVAANKISTEAVAAASFLWFNLNPANTMFWEVLI